MTKNSDKLAHYFSLELKFIFALSEKVLPPVDVQFEQLRKLCLSFSQNDLPIHEWYPSASSIKKSLLSPAFENDRVSQRAIDLENDRDDMIRTVGVWNGREGDGSAALTLMYNTMGVSDVSFLSDEISSLKHYDCVVKIIEDALQIWPLKIAEAAPFAYSADLKLFPSHSGVGWMLYLPNRIEIEQVPEARMIKHVKDLNGTEGTIIISEIDGPFYAENSEHVKVANVIETRLADLGLLPCYADLFAQIFNRSLKLRISEDEEDEG